MKKIRMFSIASVFFLFLTLVSKAEVPDLDPACCSGSWSIWQALCPANFTLCGELLYLKPSVEQESFVVTSSLNQNGDEFFPSGQRHFNCASYKPGFRIEGLVGVCGRPNVIDLRFTYFDGGPSRSVSGPFLFDTIGYPGEGSISSEDTAYSGTAHIQEHFRFYSVDLTFNRLSLDSCIDNLFLKFGLHYANIRHRTNFASVGTTPGEEPGIVGNYLRSHSNFWGIGPLLGIDYRFNVLLPECWFGNFDLIFNARAALLCSNIHAQFHYNTVRTEGTEGVNLDNDHVFHVNPMFDMRLGAGYECCFFCTDWCIELGYEWIWYHNSIDSITGLDVAFPGISLDVYNNLSLHGPYLRLCTNF